MTISSFALDLYLSRLNASHSRAPLEAPPTLDLGTTPSLAAHHSRSRTDRPSNSAPLAFFAALNVPPVSFTLLYSFL